MNASIAFGFAFIISCMIYIVIAEVCRRRRMRRDIDQRVAELDVTNDTDRAERRAAESKVDNQKQNRIHLVSPSTK